MTLDSGVASKDRRLWAAVILQAVADVDLNTPTVTPGSRGKKQEFINEEFNSIRTDAINWLTEDASYVGSFRWICDSLGLDFYRLQNMALTKEGRKKLRGNDKRNKIERDDTESDEGDV